MRLPIDAHHSPRDCCRPRTPNHGNSPATPEMATWSLNSPDPNRIEHLWDVLNKSDPWRLQCGSDLAPTRQSLETGPLVVFCVVWHQGIGSKFFFTVVGFLGGASRDWTCSHAQLDGYLGNLRSQVEALSFWSRSLDRSGAVFVVWQGALSGWGAGLKDWTWPETAFGSLCHEGSSVTLELLEEWKWT